MRKKNITISARRVMICLKTDVSKSNVLVEKKKMFLKYVLTCALQSSLVMDVFFVLIFIRRFHSIRVIELKNDILS